MRRLALAALLALAACSPRAPTRCERVCARAAECAEELEREHDRTECIEECASLERDPQLHAAVDRHVRCVMAARSCEQVLACD
jgi:hypothetical protein